MTMGIKRIIAETCRIQAIPAPTFQEQRRAGYMLEAFRELNLDDIHADEAGNVYARRAGGNRQPLIVSAHLDSVFPQGTDLRLVQDGERLTGPGVGDNALSLAVLLELAREFSPHTLDGDLWLVATVGEEGLGNLEGMRRLVKQFGSRVSAYLVLEGIGLGHIYCQGLPISRYRLMVEGPGGHSWTQASRPSAIHALVEIGQAVAQLKIPRRPRTTVNIGRIEGGTTINTIAAQASMEVDLRSLEQTALDRVVREFKKVVQSYHHPDLDIELIHLGDRPGGGLSADHPLLRLASQALTTAGVDKVVIEAGSTDASIPLSLGYPAICIGLTRGGEAHSVNEYIEVEPLARGYAALAALIPSAFSLSSELDK